MTPKTTKKPAKKKTKKAEKKVTTVSAAAILRAENDRLNVLAKAMKGKGLQTVRGMAWAYELSAAFLDSLNAPERIHKFKEIKDQDESK